MEVTEYKELFKRFKILVTKSLKKTTLRHPRGSYYRRQSPSLGLEEQREEVRLLQCRTLQERKVGWGGTQTFEEEALGQEGAMRLALHVLGKL